MGKQSSKWPTSGSVVVRRMGGRMGKATQENFRTVKLHCMIPNDEDMTLHICQRRQNLHL